MKFKSVPKKPETPVRIVGGFLMLPKTLETGEYNRKQTRWLEYAEWFQWWSILSLEWKDEVWKSAAGHNLYYAKWLHILEVDHSLSEHVHGTTMFQAGENRHVHG